MLLKQVSRLDIARSKCLALDVDARRSKAKRAVSYSRTAFTTTRRKVMTSCLAARAVVSSSEGGGDRRVRHRLRLERSSDSRQRPGQATPKIVQRGDCAATAAPLRPHACLGAFVTDGAPWRYPRSRWPIYETGTPRASSSSGPAIRRTLSTATWGAQPERVNAGWGVEHHKAAGEIQDWTGLRDLGVSPEGTVKLQASRQVAGGPRDVRPLPRQPTGPYPLTRDSRRSRAS
jgi:hypothetical protein